MDIYGNEYSGNAQAKSVLKKITDIGDAQVNVDMFREFTRQHQALLFPAFNMQTALQTRILGCRFWSELAKKRIEITQVTYLLSCVCFCFSQ